MNLDAIHTLARSPFLRSPWTWERVGTEVEYLDWLTRRACCCCGGLTNVQPVTVMRHPTRYPWAPLCEPCVVLLVKRGARKLGGRILSQRKLAGRTAREYLEDQRTEHGTEWAFVRLPIVLGAKGWGDLSRKQLTQWALRHGLYAELVRALTVTTAPEEVTP